MLQQRERNLKNDVAFDDMTGRSKGKQRVWSGLPAVSANKKKVSDNKKRQHKTVQGKTQKWLSISMSEMVPKTGVNCFSNNNVF